jgi:hypothetical protein
MKFNKVLKTIEEAIEIGENNPNFYDPNKLAEDEAVEEYKHMLYSNNYQKVIERLCQYTGKDPEELGNYPLLRAAVDLLDKIKKIETANKEKLEELAVKMVLNLEEMQPVREAIADGVLKIDAKIAGTGGELENAITDLEAQVREAEQKDEQGEPVVEGEGLTEEEKLNIALAMNIMGEEEIKERKSFADVLKYGEAFNHLYSYNLVKDQIDEINPDLANMYGLASAIVQVMYYYAPQGVEGMAAKSPGAALGSAETQPEEGTGEEGEGKYVVKARAMTFSFLIHEIVKGIMQYITMMDELRNVEKTASLEGETRKARFAQEQVKQILSLIPTPFIKHKYYIYQQLMQLPIEDLNEIQAGGGRARSIVNQIIKDMANEFGLDPETGEEIEEYKDTEISGEDEDDTQLA